VRIAVLSLKVLAMIFFFMWTRWSWPRFRYDQLMDLAWKAMIPLGLINLVVSGVCEEFLPKDDYATRCILSWLTVVGCVVFAAMSVTSKPVTSATAKS
jgi:hypothetical protein